MGSWNCRRATASWRSSTAPSGCDRKSTRVQSDILNRVQESRGHLEVEIRKLLHEVSRVAEQALSNARKVREEGAPAVEAAEERLGTLEREVVKLGDVAVLSSPA